ncbi:50S ribosomal protein L9 [[Mycoplasma] gypis]|uniref:Large ribosomal subunit protein bL9 n=1 Tax=[Mycoplasma] gypis TaxID=92404 RepID=A0ABZ2RPP9_9BACT|nr:50S ribosomal protein L9 [[Mycoplasma] gypis]MBN0919100.1 50S ribosomal protein L9 [[Mycoplasma] gypis]
MKVIIIKPYQKYKVNEIIEAKDGFAKNFLIKNGYAQPVNSATLKNRERVLENLAENEQQRIYEANLLKAEIEKVQLNFELKVHNETVHGSITTKAIEKELSKFNIKLPEHSLESIKISTLGNHGVAIKLHPSVKAFLKVKITEAK